MYFVKIEDIGRMLTILFVPVVEFYSEVKRTRLPENKACMNDYKS